MQETITTVGSYVIEVGLWKFYVSLVAFLISITIFLTAKDKRAGEKLIIIANLIMIIVSTFFIISGHIAQLLL